MKVQNSLEECSAAALLLPSFTLTELLHGFVTLTSDRIWSQNLVFCTGTTSAIWDSQAKTAAASIVHPATVRAN